MEFQNIDAEKASLGSMLLSSEALSASVEIMGPEDYFSSSHQIIYRAILELVKQGKIIDFVTLSEKLQNKKELIKIGGTEYLTKIMGSVPAWQNIEYYNEIIKKKSNQRKIWDILEKAKTGKMELEEAVEQISTLPVIKIKEEDLKALLKDTLKVSAKGVAHKFEIGHFNKYLGGIDKGEILTIGGYPSQGKCLKKGTRVVMFSGKLKKVEDIKMGDFLMGTDSTPRKVINLYSGIDDLYIVKQHRGIDYTVNSRHILTLKKSNYAKRKHFRKDRGYSSFKYPSYSDIVNIPIKEYISKSDGFKKHFQGYKTGVEFSYKDIAIDPYFLGIWIGDGDKRRTRITTTNKEVKKFLYQYSEKLSLKISESIDKRNNVKYYTFRKKYHGYDKNILMKRLEQYNLINNKYIPDDYLYNTKEIRLRVLAGLIDTDGYKNCNGYQITQKSKKLAYQIYYLASSLGFRCHIREVIKNIKTINFRGMYYQIGIVGDVQKIPVLIEQKKIKINKQTRNPLTTGIKVEYEGKGEYLGFTLDGDGFFLLEDFTVLHNTDLAIQLAIDFAWEKETKVLYLSSEMTSLEIARRLLSNLMPKNIMDFRKGNFEEGDREALESIANSVGDYWNLNIKKVFDMSDIREYVHLYNPEILIVDYLQNLDRKGAQTDYQKVTGNIKDLQTITLGREITTFVVSQLSRSKNVIRKPKLSDLRDSGRIEECSNIVIFVYWEERLKEKIEKRTGGEPPEKMEILIAKNRDGTIGRFSLDFYPEWCQIKEQEHKEYEY